MEELKNYFKNRLQENFSLAPLTTLGIGGPAKYYLEVNSEEELIQAIKLAKTDKIAFLIIGGGSNLLIADAGVDCLVIKNSISGIKKEGEAVVAQAGTTLQDLVDFTISEGLAGLNKMTGIPGTVGGAVYGNAGAYGQTISDHLLSVECLKNGGKVTLLKEECDFSYRDSGFKQNKYPLLSLKFSFPKGDKLSLKTESLATLKLRQKKYLPGIKCPGSFFRNLLTSEILPQTLAKLPPREDTYGKTPAYLFLENLGAKGDKLGNIEIAPHHANLFINTGQGRASDFYNLALKWFRKVKARYGIILEPEVQLINLPPFS